MQPRKGSIISKPLTFLPSFSSKTSTSSPPPLSTTEAAPSPQFTTAEAPATAAEAVNMARRSQRVSLLGGLNPDHFTAARNTRDASTALALSFWLSEETKIKVRGEPDLFLEDLKSGVVLCVLANKFSAFKFNNPPKSEFHRMENFELFTKALKPLKLLSQPPSATKIELSAILPSLLELAQRASGRKESDKDDDVKDTTNFFCVLCKGATSFETTKMLMDHLETKHANLALGERDATSHGRLG